MHDEHDEEANLDNPNGSRALANQDKVLAQLVRMTTAVRPPRKAVVGCEEA